MSDRQHAPSPDYGSGTTPEAPYVDLQIRFCCECGDLCLTDAGCPRCDTCQAEHLDEVAIAHRVVKQHRNIIIAKALDGTPAPVPQLVCNKSVWPSRSGGMNDPRGLTCEECGDVACWYVGSVDPLDGIHETCASCGTAGRISVDQDDEGNVRARFLGEP